MKKLFALVALVLGVVSCQTDPNDLDVVVGGEREVMLNVSLPEATRSASNAGFDFTNFESNEDYDLRYILEIRYNGHVSRTVKTAESTSVSFPVRLAPGREYDFTVWADLVLEGSEDDLCYNTNVDGAGLTNITIKNEKWTPNNELRDAYYGKATLTEEQSITNLGTIELTRPFAKVRVVATDIEDVLKFGIEPDNAIVTYTVGLPTTFNAVSGTVAGSATTISPIAYNIVADAYTENTNELTVFADYIFVPENGTISFNLNVKDGDDIIKENNFSTAIPVVKNKLTTIKGAVLTEGGDVSIKIENGLGELETINLVDTAADLQEIINNTPDGESANITLGGDIDLNDLFGISTLSTRAAEPAYGLLIPAGKSVVLDLKGFTISQSKTQTAAYSMIENLGTLTIKDDSANKTGKISYADNGQGGNYVSNTIHNSGLLTIEGGIVENNSSAAVASNGFPHPIDNSGTLVINDGTFTNNANYSSMRIWCTTDDDTIVTINGGTFNGSIDFQTPSASANKGTLTINGGTFNADTYTKCAVRLLGFGADVDEMNGYILGGHFNGAIALKKYINGEFNSKVFDITAGTFTTEAKEGTNIALVNDDYAWVEIENGLWTVEHKADVVKIGEVGYTSLAKAVADVKDGETITLASDIIFDENSRQSSGGTWYEGLYYIGNKSFTIDLNGKTISQNGAVNDYLFLLKNDTNTENTINFINGTIDAGTSAYCALCTSTTSTAKITINLENVNLNGNNSNGAVAKIRGGAELNVKSGTVITGADSYLGIENWNATVNVFEGAEIYMNGTTSYNGCLIGVGGNGVVNVYDGYGKGVSGGLIAMTSGGTINVSGGEWIANTDGTYANSNKSVLVAQSDKQHNAGAGNAVVNVTGGTFKGGYNCYGNAVGDAQININGGNFNSNPANYVVAGYGAVEKNGVWTVAKAYDITEGGATIYSAAGMLWFANEVNVNKNAFNGKTVTLANDIDLNNENWAGIGTSEANFCGTFDGYNHTIKNLNILVSEGKEGKAYLGLFGYAKNATIKNVVFENVDINVACLDIDHSQGHIGAVAGSLEGTSTIENVTVQGDVKVYSTQDANGASRVAVVAGGNSYGNVTMKNVHVVANEGSYLIANNNTGALAGQLQGKSVFENCSSNIDVTVNKFFAGGIIGLAAGDQTFTNCHTTGNIAVVAGREGRAHDQYRVGGIAGGWSDGKNNVCTLVNCSYTGNVSGKNSDGSVANPLDYMGYVGRGYTLNGCKGSTVNIDGVRYVQKYDTAAEAGIYDVTDAEGNVVVSTFAELEAALQAGGNIALGADIALDNPIQVNNKEFYLNGRGHKIGQSSAYNIEGTSTAALIHPIGCTAIIENIVFDGIKGDGPIRTVDTKINIKNITVQNCERTATGSTAQGLFRLHGESIVTACTFKNNICPMGVSLNWDGDNNLPQSVTNCVFEGNTCHATAVLYYVKGSECKVIGNKFVDNTVTVESGNNAATVYMGFTENNVITGNLFQNNTVNAGTSKRVAGGIMIGYEAEITGNAFIGNSVTGENAKGNDVCASVYYTDIDLSGNYWGGGAPVENDDYFVEYTNYKVIVNDYLTENPIK